MYDSKYMSQIAGSRNKSIFRTSAFSSSGVHVSSPETSICFVLSISFMSEASSDCGVDDIFVNERGVTPEDITTILSNDREQGPIL